MSTIIEEKDDNTKKVRADNNTSVRYGNYNDDTRNSKLKFLENLDDYKVHHDDIDPRGYSVKLTTGENVGEVEGLLADPDRMLVRYVEVEVDEDLIKRHTKGHYKEEDRHALFPVGMIHIDKDDNSITLLGLETNHVIDYPRFERKSGYTTRYEVDANDYLSDFHEYGSSYNRDKYSTDTFRSADRFDDDFYSSKFYTNRNASAKV